MEIILLIIVSLTLIAIGVFYYIFHQAEKKRIALEIIQHSNLMQQLADINTKFYEISHKQAETIKELFASQDKKNEKLVQDENAKILNEIKDSSTEIKLRFKEYTQKVQDNLIKITEENQQLKIETNKVKEQIQYELNNILKEIKAPLDLD